MNNDSKREHSTGYKCPLREKKATCFSLITTFLGTTRSIHNWEFGRKGSQKHKNREQIAAKGTFLDEILELQTRSELSKTKFKKSTKDVEALKIYQLKLVKFTKIRILGNVRRRRLKKKQT